MWTITPSGDGPSIAFLPGPEPRCYDGPGGSLVWGPHGLRALFLGRTGALWDAAARRVLVRIPFAESVGGAGLSADGAHLVTVTRFGARHWNLDDLSAQETDEQA